MTGGSTLVSFDVLGGKAAAFRFANALEIIKISNNLGDAKSIITHPATTTHQRLTPEARAAMGINDGMLRLSVGLEDPQDLIDDIAQALDGAGRAGAGGGIAPAPSRTNDRSSHVHAASRAASRSPSCPEFVPERSDADAGPVFLGLHGGDRQPGRDHRAGDGQALEDHGRQRASSRR